MTTRELVTNEARTLAAALALHQQGISEFHGYLLAGQLREQPDDERPMAYSTLYRCLTRLEDKGYVASRGGESVASGGPPRRLFSLTESGFDQATELDPSLNPFVT